MQKMLLFACACLVLACGPQPSRPADPLSGAVIRHQPDVPVPLNFNYMPDRSRVETFSTFRVCEMVYESTADARHGVTAIFDFYTRLMPAYDWSAADGPAGKDTLMFKKNGKDDEFCRVKVWRQGKLTTIYILIGNAQLTQAKDA
ncbi:MAG: hypothetical protein ABIF71_15540 [Planctomycetota bacterium]